MTRMLLEADCKVALNPFAQIAKRQGIRVVFLQVAQPKRNIGVFNGVGDIVSQSNWKSTPKRKLGTLEKKMSLTLASDFKMTDEELIGV